MRIDAASLQEQLLVIKVDAEKLLSDLSDAQFNWRPGLYVWSIAQCLDHLNIFGRQYFPILIEKIAQAEKRNVLRGGSYDLGFLGKLFLRLTEPPVRSRFKAPNRFLPAPEKQLYSVGEEFQSLQDKAIALIQQAEKLHWRKIKVASPESKLLKLNLASILAIVVAHERRHLWQAWQIRNHCNFPARDEDKKN